MEHGMNAQKSIRTYAKTHSEEPHKVLHTFTCLGAAINRYRWIGRDRYGNTGKPCAQSSLS